ncbi:MAG: hypothetical protein QJR02_11550 [Sinobacteraceae bacterium]|nr:hypothetical protein [Nevskia sp.]MDI3260320.1 hypothetical protein [Nevskiaceae bacterium]
MNPFRLLILAAIAWFVWRVLRSWNADALPPRRRTPRDPQDYERMARCLRCGVFVPRDRLSENGRCGECERRLRA